MVNVVLEDVMNEIKKDISENDVILFMKGTKNSPRCGFSGFVVQVLMELGVSFHTVDVLLDENIRSGIKQFSDWPTIPQLYVKGKFIGGSDIVREMYISGELEELLKKENLI